MSDERDGEPPPERGEPGRRGGNRLWETLILLLLWRWRAPRRARGPQAGLDATEEWGDRDRLIERRVGAPAWAERLIAATLGVVPLGALGFVALFVLDPDTQLLGLSLAVALAALAIAFILAGRFLVPQEQKIEHRPRLADPGEVQTVASTLGEGFDGITRRRMLLGAAGVAGAGLTAAAVIPVVALGPGLERQLSQTPWHAGRALVDEEGKPVLAGDVIERSFLTAFPEGASMDNLGSPIVVVRVDPRTLQLPAGRAGWAPEGLLAYSKICTHAGCAISLYRSPLSPSTQARGPALVCPCHYSTFDVLDGAKVEFGPAGRPLPQLPLRIAAGGALVAGGPMSSPVGPSWWDDPA
ncbi:MAG: QcrA and Rieske domain-containing protein [Solirubrobacteraceae bacterium]